MLVHRTHTSVGSTGYGDVVADASRLDELDLGLEPPLRRDAVLFGEAESRAVISVDPADLPALAELAERSNVPWARLGVVGGERLVIGPIDVPVTQARSAWEGGLAMALGWET